MPQTSVPCSHAVPTPYQAPLQKLTSLSLGLPLLGSVALNPVQELLPALGVLDMLNTEVDTLLHVSTVDDLVADNSDTTWGNVVYDTGLTVVVCAEEDGGESV
jgi:hypothetical protein